MKRISLPIDAYLDLIVEKGRKHPTLLVKASPGSGKTTRLPWHISRLTDKKVVVLEPRRLAAKLAAERIAQEEGFDIGQEVGYQFRFDKKTTDETKLTFYTEGTFLRLLVNNPELSDVGIVIFDEFHERHIETDLAFALVRSIQEKRPDLLVIVMSATLDTSIQSVFKSPALIEIDAPRFPVDVHYLPNRPSILNQSLETKIKNTIETITIPGDILVFVPGMREMNLVRDRLGNSFGEVYLLHSELSRQEQDLALGKSEKRKIILATNIAESSITISGIRIVIDSGIQREGYFSPWTGLKTLQDRPITQSSAIQRMGRAGREAPGECWRLYSKQDYDERIPYTVPEIQTADLLDTLILTKNFNEELHWPLTPPLERWKRAQELALLLGLIDEDGNLTREGSEVQRIPLDARLAKSILSSRESTEADQKKLIRYIASDIEKDRSGRIEKRISNYLPTKTGDAPWEKSLLMGFVDQVARYRSKQNDFIHYSGKSFRPHKDLGPLEYDFYLILDVNARGEALQIVPILEEWLMDISPFPFHEDNVIEISKFTRKTKTLIGSILIDEVEKKFSYKDLSPELQSRVIELASSPFKKGVAEYQKSERWGKIHFWSTAHSIELEDALPSVEDFLEGQESWEDLPDFIFQHVLEKLQITDLDRILPSKIDLGGRRELVIHYPMNLDPFVEAPIQDFYGQKSVPSLLNGKFPLQIKLLGPHKRPIQVTKDLAGFWSKMYQEMKRELMREYPRHYWPDDPANSRPFLLKSHVK